MIRLDWEGETNRPLGLKDWCPCGTCSNFKTQTDPDSVGFLSWSDEEGVGCSIILRQDEYDMLEDLLQDLTVTSDDCIEALEKQKK